jgi:hypothetical protein
MTPLVRILILAFLGTSLLACSRDTVSREEFAELMELMRAERSGEPATRSSQPPTMPPPSGSPGSAGPAGAAAAPNPTTIQPGIQGGIPAAAPGSVSPLILGTPATAESRLEDVNLLVLSGTAWSGPLDRLPFLADRNLPQASVLVFRGDNLHVMSPEGVLAFDVDYNPGDLLCQRIRPCFSVTDETGRVHTVHYEIIDRENRDDTQKLVPLDCIHVSAAEGGVFPNDSALRENGGLRAVHRTTERLCVARIGDLGLHAVALDAVEETTGAE